MNFDRVEQFLSRLPITNRDTNQTSRFILFPNQLKMHRTIWENQASKGRPIRYVSPKSRRVGVSSYTDALLSCQCASKSLQRSLIVAHQYKSSKALFSVPLGLVKGFPHAIPDPTQHAITFPHKKGDSVLSLATAGSVVGGRGMTLSGLHLSEAAYFPGSGSFMSLLPTVSKTDPDSIIGIESTANGKSGVGESFYNLCMAALNGDSEYLFIFLGWLDDPACVRDPAEASDAPKTAIERELMGKPFRASKAQIAWMRVILESECEGLEDNFMQEYPWTWEVAFLSSGDPAFSHADMAKARAALTEPVGVGHLVRQGKNSVRFEEARGGWTIYEHPRRDCFYYIGGDAARGVRTGDFASAVIWNGTTGRLTAVYEDKVDPETFADILDCAGRYYRTGQLTAKLNVELTGNLGLWTQQLLRDFYHYPNLYRWLSRNDRVKKGTVQKGGSLGWETQWRSRERLFVVFRAALAHGRAIPCDERLLVQMELAQRSERVFNFEVTKGHDDILMAALIGWIAIEDYPPPKITNVGKMLVDWAAEEDQPREWRAEKVGTVFGLEGQALQGSEHLAGIKMRSRRRAGVDRLGML